MATKKQQDQTKCVCGAPVNMMDGRTSSCCVPGCSEMSCSAVCANKHHYGVHEKRSERSRKWMAVNGFDAEMYRESLAEGGRAGK